MKYLAILFAALMASCRSTNPPVEAFLRTEGESTVVYDTNNLIVSVQGKAQGVVRDSATKFPIYVLNEEGKRWRIRQRSTGLNESGEIGVAPTLEAWAIVELKMTPQEIIDADLTPPGPPPPQP